MELTGGLMLANIDWNENTLGVVMGCAIPIVAIVASFWFKIERTRSDNDLKRSMIDRGMSVEEIERVLSMRTPKQ
jgi:hypothetical protein